MFYSLDDVSQFLYDNKLFDEILYIPHNKLKLFLFILKNIFRFPKVYVPVKTFFSVLLKTIKTNPITQKFKMDLSRKL